MLEKVINIALEKYAGDRELSGEFVKSFIKEAASVPETAAHMLSKGFTTGIGAGLAGLLVGAGIHGVSSAIGGMRSSSLHEDFSVALQKAVSGNRILQTAPKGKVEQYANTIFKFAPNVATDPNLLTAILSNAIHGDGIDPMTIKTLTELEERYNKNATSPVFSPKAYV